MVPPGGTREKSSGVLMPSAPPKAKKHPRHPHNRGISAEMQCGTASRAARDLTGEPCSPVNPFFLEGGFSADFVGGPGGRPHLPEWHSSSVPPGAFSLGPLQRPVLFSREKRMGGCEAPLLEGVTSAPSGRIEKLGRALRGTPVPRRGISHPAARGRNSRPRAVRGIASPPQRKNPKRGLTFPANVLY